MNKEYFELYREFNSQKYSVERIELNEDFVNYAFAVIKRDINDLLDLVDKKKINIRNKNIELKYIFNKDGNDKILSCKLETKLDIRKNMYYDVGLFKFVGKSTTKDDKIKNKILENLKDKLNTEA